jgi:hypothetical protein
MTKKQRQTARQHLAKVLGCFFNFIISDGGVWSDLLVFKTENDFIG